MDFDQALGSNYLVLGYVIVSSCYTTVCNPYSNDQSHLMFAQSYQGQ